MICGNLCHPFWNGSQHPSWAKFGPILGKQEPRVRPAISGRISVGGYGRLWPVTKKAKGTGPSFHLWWLHRALALILSHCRSLGLTPWVWEMLLGLREHSLSKGKRRGCVCVCVCVCEGEIIVLRSGGVQAAVGGLQTTLQTHKNTHTHHHHYPQHHSQWGLNQGVLHRQRGSVWCM